MATEVKDRYLAAGAGMGAEKWIDVAGIRTRYFDEGAGERVVFIHGVQMGATDGASSAKTWELNFPVLARRHNAIAFDKLGQGYTDNPKSDADYTMHAIVQHAIGFLDALGKKPYHIVGHSRGGYVVTRIAMERPDLVKTLIPVSSGTLSPAPTRTHLVHRNPPLPRLSRESVRWYCERYSFNPKIVTEEWLDGVMAIAAQEKNRIAIRKMSAEGLLKKQFLPRLARQKAEVIRFLLEKGVHCPTLVVWGWNDPAALVENGMQLVELFMKHQRATEVRLFNQSGHYVMREQAGAFNRAIDAFVARMAEALADAGTAPVLRVENLSIHVVAEGGRRLKIVERVDFDIMPGEFFALVGESGSGKTMIARAIMRLLPDATVEIGGAIRLSGEDVTRAPEARLRQLRGARMGMIFQEPMTSLDPLMTIGRQIGEAIDAHARVSGADRKRRVLELLAAVRFAEPELVYGQYPHELSGGMRQRAVIAMALVNDPDLLVADEPTTALDVTIEGQILDIIASLARERGLAVLLITHDLGLVRRYADAIGVLYAGVLMERGPAREVIGSPAHPYTAALLRCAPRRRVGGARQQGIEGTVPGVGDWWPGCRFRPRCERAVEACGRGDIALAAVGDRVARCVAPS